MEKTAERVELTHDQAVPVLKILDLDKNSAKMKPVELAALTHYVRCEICRNEGLGNILGVEITHQDAVLTWARNPGDLSLFQDRSLHEELAVEHIMGPYTFKHLNGGGEGYNIDLACDHFVCGSLRVLWVGAPLSSSYDGWNEVARELSDILRSFTREGWPLGDLIEIMKDRQARLLENIRNRRINVSEGHYHELSDLEKELKTIQASLAGLALELYEHARKADKDFKLYH